MDTKSPERLSLVVAFERGDKAHSPESCLSHIEITTSLDESLIRVSQTESLLGV